VNDDWCAEERASKPASSAARPVIWKANAMVNRLRPREDCLSRPTPVSGALPADARFEKRDGGHF